MNPFGQRIRMINQGDEVMFQMLNPQNGTAFLGQTPQEVLVKFNDLRVDESGMRFATPAKKQTKAFGSLPRVSALTLDREFGMLEAALEEEAATASMLRSLGDSMNADFHPKSLPLPGGGVMELAGFSAAPNVVCEVCAVEGPLSVQAEEAAVASALKLLHAAQVLGNTARLVLLFRDRVAARQFCSSPRCRSVVEETGVEIRVVAA